MFSNIDSPPPSICIDENLFMFTGYLLVNAVVYWCTRAVTVCREKFVTSLATMHCCKEQRQTAEMCNL